MIANPKPGTEERFIRCWAEMTELIKVECGGLGSRLHRAADGTLFAYAQWPSREAWERMGAVEASGRRSELSREWAEISNPSETIFAGDVVTDLLNEPK